MAQNERDRFLEWSRSFGLNGQTAAELLNHMPDDSVLDPELPCWISSPSYAMAAQGLGVEDQLRREGFLVVGSCPNGDPVLVGFRDPKLPVYYLSHEELHCKPVSQIMRKVSDSIAAYDKALSDENAEIPLDYWDRKNG